MGTRALDGNLGALRSDPLISGAHTRVHDLLCKIRVDGGLALIDEDEYHELVLI